MITSQRPLMLEAALELARLVQDQHAETWEDVKSVDNYLKRLQDSVERLSRENNFLAIYHAKIREKVQPKDF